MFLGWHRRGLPRRNAPLFVLLLALPLSLLTQCSDSSDSVPSSSAAGHPVGAGQSGSGGQSASGGYAGSGGQSGSGGLPATPCASTSDCALPRSVCSDAATLTFFTDPLCRDGTCRWLAHDMSCPGGCVAAGCTFFSTGGGLFGGGGLPGGGGISGAGGMSGAGHEEGGTGGCASEAGAAGQNQCDGS